MENPGVERTETAEPQEPADVEAKPSARDRIDSAGAKALEIGSSLLTSVREIGTSAGKTSAAVGRASLKAGGHAGVEIGKLLGEAAAIFASRFLLGAITYGAGGMIAAVLLSIVVAEPRYLITRVLLGTAAAVLHIILVVPTIFTAVIATSLASLVLKKQLGRLIGDAIAERLVSDHPELASKPLREFVGPQLQKWVGAAVGEVEQEAKQNMGHVRRLFAFGRRFLFRTVANQLLGQFGMSAEKDRDVTLPAAAERSLGGIDKLVADKVQGSARTAFFAILGLEAALLLLVPGVLRFLPI